MSGTMAFPAHGQHIGTLDSIVPNPLNGTMHCVLNGTPMVIRWRGTLEIFGIWSPGETIWGPGEVELGASGGLLEFRVDQDEIDRLAVR